MNNSSNFEITLPNSILILGRPGTGKTTLALQFPKPFILDCDKNMVGPVRFLARKQGSMPAFKFDTPLLDKAKAPVDRRQRFDRARELLDEALADPEVETIIVDSLTTLIDFIFDKIRVNSGLKFSDGKKQSDDPLRIQDWGIFASVLKQLIFQLKASGKRIIFIGHITTEKDEVDKIFRDFIAIPGQTGDIIAGLFEEVWQTDIKSTGAEATLKADFKIRTVGGAAQQNLGLKSAGQLGPYLAADAQTIIQKLLTADTK